MNPVYLSIRLHHLQFISSVFYSFLSRDLLSPIIPMYFIIFDAMVNEIVFLISLSDTSSLVYRNATDFCI